MSDAPRVTYQRVTEGDWVSPRRRGYRMMCCDCGLVHILNFRLVRVGRGFKIQLQAFRDNRATASSRRARFKRAATEGTKGILSKSDLERLHAAG